MTGPIPAADSDRMPVDIAELVHRANAVRHVRDFRMRALVAAVDDLAEELIWLRRRYLEAVDAQIATYVDHLIATGEIENYREDTA